MKKRGINKRGISPLIATVLLVAFVVALAIIAFLWAKHFVSEQAVKRGAVSQQTLNCATDVEIKITNAYVSEDKIYITIENLKSNTVDGFVIRIIGANSVEPIEIYQQPLKPLEVGVFVSEFHEDVTGSVKEIEIIPRLRVAKGIYVPCVDKKIVYEMI